MTTTTPARSRLTVRSLATIGIFTAVLFVLSIVVGSLTAIHPVVYLFNPSILALTGAVFYVLIAVRVRATGAVLLTAVLFGIAWGVLGGWLLTVFMLVAGVLGELLVARTRYRSILAIGAAWTLFGLANFGGVFGVAWVATESYLANGERLGQDPAYMASIIDALHNGGAFLALGATIIGSVLGVLFARRVLRKHFDTAA